MKTLGFCLLLIVMLFGPSTSRGSQQAVLKGGGAKTWLVVLLAVTKLGAVTLPPATSQSHYTEPVHRTAVRRMLWPTGNNHLPLEALPLVLNNVKVLQVQVNVVAPVAASRGHVPHHGEGQVTQNGWRRCGRHRRRGAVGEAWTGGGGM